MRRTIIGGILALWAVMMAALLLDDPRHDAVSLPSIEDATLNMDDAEGAWWGIYLQGHKVGFVHHSLRHEASSVAFRQESVLHLTTLGEAQRIRTTAFGEMTREFSLRSLQFALDAGPSRLHLEAVAEGDSLRVTLSPKAEPTIIRGPVYLPIGLRTAASKAPLEAGRIVRGPVFDPLTRTNGVLELKVIGLGSLPGEPERAAWRIEESWRDLETVLWVDEEGRLLREEGPMGLVAIRESEAEAKRIAKTDGWDAVDAVSLRVERPLEDPRGRSALRVRLLGLPHGRIPAGGGQSADESGISIRKIAPAEMESYTLPYSEPDLASELAPTATIQADHPRLRSLAATIVGSEHDALTAVRLLVDWVHRYLRKTPTASFPDAIEILDMGQGDCNEHAVLLTALMRAAGIPARVVGGLVYGDGAFLYHAWTDVWLGRWVPVDAALNQLPADVTHIRLVEGDVERQMPMMGMMGNLSIEIIEDPTPG